MFHFMFRILYLPPINGPNCGNRALVITGVKNEEDQATNEEENERCIAVYHLPAVKDNEKIKVTFFGEKSTAGKKELCSYFLIQQPITLFETNLQHQNPSK